MEEHEGRLHNGRHFNTEAGTAVGTVFGGYTVPMYNRGFDPELVGDRGRLPRGEIMEGNGVSAPPPKEGFFTSIFVSTQDELLDSQAGAKQREKEAWEAKVVVDDPVFRVGGFVQPHHRASTLRAKHKPHPFDRADDILKGPAKALGVRRVRNAKLPSGKRLPKSTFDRGHAGLNTEDVFAEPPELTYVEGALLLRGAAAATTTAPAGLRSCCGRPAALRAIQHYYYYCCCCWWCCCCCCCCY